MNYSGLHSSHRYWVLVPATAYTQRVFRPLSSCQVLEGDMPHNTSEPGHAGSWSCANITELSGTAHPLDNSSCQGQGSQCRGSFFGVFFGAGHPVTHKGSSRSPISVDPATSRPSRPLSVTSVACGILLPAQNLLFYYDLL